MFQRLLICTDLSDGLHRLARCVNSLADAGVTHVTFLYSKPVVESEGIPRLEPEEVEAATAAIQRWIPENSRLEVAIDVQMGQIADCILRAADKYQADLILLGTDSKSNLNEKLFGSTTRDLAKKTKIPLMIFRPQLLDVMMLEELLLRCQYLFKRVLIPYDGSATSNYVVDEIHQLASAKSGVEVCTLCWVYSDHNWLSLSGTEQQEISNEKLIPAETKLAEAGVKTHRVVRHGNALEGILTTAQEEDISAIAIASSSLGKLLEWTTPSLTGQLIRRSWYPVIFFPQKK
ncbi:universal stress protein [filamentous cyanobacterium LEGE 11480]|uniref:Universal stress protein n=1 Tax=Romeriopsis navalis LEGE 11480 TaxID=2777977 RepID=A0A928VH09_9CYAN|nr:universal stress protein [Romeriopsis navalis]MBE9028170.1 universal stress protein [Romeriopsis navalis LEGE 11480]